MSMNEKILEALEASLKRIQEKIHVTTDRAAEATLFCKSEDIKLAVAVQTATMDLEKFAKNGGVAE